jgi:hypothetical protein
MPTLKRLGLLPSLLLLSFGVARAQWLTQTLELKAGWHAVFAGPNDDDADPHDPATSGGESFDLAEVGLTEARFVRVVDRADLAGFNGTFDLDAIALVHWTCDAP